MRFGLNVGYSGARIALDMPLIKEADRLGFHSVWTAEAYGSDAVTPLAWIAAQTEQIHVATGIMQMPARTPAMTAMTATTLDQLSGGRFLLGLGVSGPQVVEGWHGVPYGKPLVKTREYIDDRPQDLGARAAARAPGRALPDPVPRPGRDRARQAAEEHPARPADPDLHRRDRPEERRADRRDRRRLAADLLLAVPHPRLQGRARGRLRAGRRRQVARQLRHRGLGDRRHRRRRPGVPRARQARSGALHRRHGRARQELLQRPRLPLRLRGRRRRRSRTSTSTARRTRRPPPSPTSSPTRCRWSARRSASATASQAWRESGVTTIICGLRQPEVLRTLVEAGG